MCVYLVSLCVQAMGWCPWQRNVVATGGGWTDGQLRIWDTESGTCVTTAGTNSQVLGVPPWGRYRVVDCNSWLPISQVCSLRWAERKRSIVTGHGLPRHHIACWTWDSTSLLPTHQLTGDRPWTSLYPDEAAGLFWQQDFSIQTLNFESL